MLSTYVSVFVILNQLFLEQILHFWSRESIRLLFQELSYSFWFLKYSLLLEIHPFVYLCFFMSIISLSTVIKMFLSNLFFIVTLCLSLFLSLFSVVFILFLSGSNVVFISVVVLFYFSVFCVLLIPIWSASTSPLFVNHYCNLLFILEFFPLVYLRVCRCICVKCFLLPGQNYFFWGVLHLTNNSSEFSLSITPPFSTVSVHAFFFVSTSSLNEVILYGTAVCSAVVKASKWKKMLNSRKKMLTIQLLAFHPQDKQSPRQRMLLLSDACSAWVFCMMVSVDFCLVHSIPCCKTGCDSYSSLRYDSSPRCSSWLRNRDGASTVSFLPLSIMFYRVSEEM